MKPEVPPSIAWLNATQFLGALNDNILKLLLIFHLIGSQGREQAGAIAASVGVAFVLPFLFFSAPAGCLADRLPKSRLIILVKAAEVAIAVLAVAAFALGLEKGLYLVIFLMGSHSAFFAPLKYGIIPELVPREQLSRANGLMESCTFLAIIAGTALGSLLTQIAGQRIWLAGCVCLAIATAGLCCSMMLRPTGALDPGRRIALFPTEIARTVSGIRKDRNLMLAITGYAWFTFVGAFAQLNLIAFGMERLGLAEAESGYLFLAAAFGIGIGSLAAARLSGRGVEFGIVPIGAAGLTLAPLLLHLAPASLLPCIGGIIVFGISAGLFSLPLQTFIQFKAAPAMRGEVLAASSFINWVGVLLASGFTWLLSGPMALSAGQGFSLVGGMTLILTLLSFRILPDFLLRFIAVMTMRLCYRLRVIGAENLPLEGGALLVPNHVTWVDALLLTATTHRRIRFVMERRIYNTPVLRGLFRLMGVIPVSAADGRKEMVEFITRARAALDEGFMVCIFAEGELTRNGMLREFRGGFERVVRNSAYPVIPVYIGGAWGSILSYAHGKLCSRRPDFAPYPVTILFGEAMPAPSTAADVRQKVAELSCDYFDSLKKGRKSLGRYFIATARKNWGRTAVTDTGGRRLTYGHALAAALALGKCLETLLEKGEEGEAGSNGQGHVGVLLPPSVAAVLVNLCLSLSGRVPVNLNYTASESSLRSAVAQCGITVIVTSGAFLDKLPTLPRLEGMVFVEDLLPRVTGVRKLTALLQARFYPARFLCGGTFHADRPATVIFSSGSTGDPKGVVLSHHNIMSNIEALRMVLRVTPEDNVCSALPFFHSLGFTATLWFPLVSGFSAAYHTNPMDGEKIAQVVREHRSTLLLATPTFLLAYLRRAKREEFASLRLVVTGAEKLKGKVADLFQEKFGIRPLEGYGATELSPVTTLSLPDVEIGGVRQYGAKEGSVGHPIPGVAMRVIDPERGTEVKPGVSGLILVKGPNVMLGYLGRSEATAEVFRDGWYVTGDIGVMDDDGFVRITDRISRFSKIGGEMVPHGVVEDELHGRLGQTGVVAVTGIPDEKKGEKLVVVYAREAADAETLHRHLVDSPLPNLWKPAKDCYIAVESLPILGTGKLDLRGLRELALALIG